MPAFQINYTQTAATGGKYTGKSPFVVDANADGLDDIMAFGLVFPPEGPGVAPGRLYIQQPDGTFVASLPLADGKELLTTLVAFGVAYVGDLNGDGVTDVFGGAMGWDAPPSPPEQNRLLLGTKDGKFVDATSQLPQRLTNTHCYAAADLDGDGDIDFIVGNIDTQGPFVMLNDGSGKFAISPGWLPASLFGGQYRLAEAELYDLNNDGNLDLVASTFHGPGKVFWGAAGNKYSDERVTVLPVPSFGSSPILLSYDAFDFNNDGLQDLLVGGVKEYVQTGGIQLLLNTGQGKFVDATAGFFAGTTLTREDVYQLLLLDVNGDGAKDIVRENVTHAMAEFEPVFWLNDGSNRFTTVTAGQLGLTGAAFDNWYKGPDGHFRVLGGVGDYLGRGFANFYTPTAELQSVFSTAGPKDDQFTATSGDQIYNGGKGLDWISYAGTRSSVTARSVSAKEVTVTDSTGQDRLISVERIKFSDGTLAFDIDGSAGQSYRIYQAAFDRTPDTGGLKYWVNQMDKGASLTEVGAGFVQSAEFHSVYGSNPSNADYVNRLYQNVLDRQGETGGFNYWVGELNSGASRAFVLASFAESPENVAAVAPQINSGIWLA